MPRPLGSASAVRVAAIFDMTRILYRQVPPRSASPDRGNFPSPDAPRLVRRKPKPRGEPRLLYSGGLRLGEALALRPTDQPRSLRLPRALTRQAPPARPRAPAAALLPARGKPL